MRPALRERVAVRIRHLQQGAQIGLVRTSAPRFDGPFLPATVRLPYRVDAGSRAGPASVFRRDWLHAPVAGYGYGIAARSFLGRLAGWVATFAASPVCVVNPRRSAAAIPDGINLRAFAASLCIAAGVRPALAEGCFGRGVIDALAETLDLTPTGQPRRPAPRPRMEDRGSLRAATTVRRHVRFGREPSLQSEANELGIWTITWIIVQLHSNSQFCCNKT